MKQILALALESAGAVGHHSLALGGSDLAAQIGLSGLAELAFLTFGSTVYGHMLAILTVGLILVFCGTNLHTRERQRGHQASRW